MGISGVVADGVREFEKSALQLLSQAGVGHGFFQRAAHALHPGVALGFSNRKATVRVAQSRWPAPWRVFLGATHPFGQVDLQDRLGGLQVRGVHGTDARCQGQRIDAPIKRLDQPINTLGAADLRKVRVIGRNIQFHDGSFKANTVPTARKICTNGQ
jgi:hypothetical protein